MKTVRIPIELEDYMMFVSNAEAGAAFKAILGYARYGQIPDMEPKERAIFHKVKTYIDKQEAWYQKKLENCQSARDKKNGSFIKEYKPGPDLE